MWRSFRLLVFVFFFPVLAFCQKAVPTHTISLFAGQSPYTIAPFQQASLAKADILAQADKTLSTFIRPTALDEIRASNQNLIRLVLPQPLDIALDLVLVDIYADGTFIGTSDGRAFDPNPNHRFYRGMISGNPNSLAVVSVFENRIQIMYADEFGNHRIQQTLDGSYLILNDQDIKLTREHACFVNDSVGTQPVEPNDLQGRQMTGNCVEVYVECDFKSYQDNGSSVSNTEEWVAELWNEVITLYANEDIPVAVSQIYVYTSTDPFAGLNTTSAILSAFASHLQGISYNGRLAHLLSTRGLGGGIAYIDVLCNSANNCAFSSSLSTNIVPVPVYSWSVEVVTHEMGHNMGSPHTHACAWNGNNTAIDGCGPAAGYSEGCDAPLPAQGTIMSYCHLVGGVGINFNNGFGPQPGDRVRNRYNNASCNTGSCSPPACTSLSVPAAGAANADINVDLSWLASPGANGYKLTVGTSPTNGSILNNVDVGNVTTYNLANPLPYSTTIYVKIVPYNELGDATSCNNQSFTTEANVAPLCTQMSSPAAGATSVSVDAVIYWNHSVGNQTGYKISIGTTPNGTEIANLIDVGNVTSYDHPTAFPYGSNIYVKITPYGSGGNVSGCPVVSFMTWVPIDGDFCNTAIPIACGQAIAASTLLALPDTGTPVCGTNIEAPGIWFTFTGDGQNAVVYTCAQYGYDTQMNAYSGTCANLNCITGLDDFCAQGTQLSFPTTVGTQYFIFVQGWNGAQGNFTLNRTCYAGPFYCQSSGYYATQEWIKKVVVDGFVKNSAASSYSDFTTEVITVARGMSYTIELTPHFPQTAKLEYYKVWADFNQNGSFNDSGEMIFSAGPTSTVVSGSISIPLTAITGNTRMRVVMSRESISSPCGTFTRGEVEDYTLNVKCNIVTTTSDSGNGSLRKVSECVEDGEDVYFSSALNGQTITLTSGQLLVDGNWKWMASAGSNIQIKAGTGVTRVLNIPSGTSAEIQNLTIIGGTSSQGGAIQNAGTLTLRDCDIYRIPGGANPPLRNTGILNIIGLTEIRK